MALNLADINVGNYENDGTGDDLKTAFTKVKDNFASVKTEMSALQSAGIANLVVDGEGENIIISVAAAASGKEAFLKGIKAGNNIAVTSTDADIVISANYPAFKLSNDTAPTLSNNLILNSNNIVGTGDITINGTVTANFEGNIVSAGSSKFANATILNGSINGTVIGDQSPTTATFTSMSAQYMHGDVVGSVSHINNHGLNSLRNVNYADTDLQVGQTLIWNGLNWVAKHNTPATFTIKHPVAGESTTLIFLPIATTIKQINAVAVGENASVTFSIMSSKDRSVATSIHLQNVVQASGSNTAPLDPVSQIVEANSWIWVTVDSATNVQELAISLQLV